MRHERISGWLLIATGFAHTAIGCVAGWTELVAMADDGLWRAARVFQDRQQVTWFLMAGGMFLLSGLLALQFGRSLPRSFGWALGLVALLGSVLFGPSGFFPVLPQALYIVLVSRGSSDLQAQSLPPPPTGPPRPDASG